MRKAKIRKPKERKRKIYRPNARVEFYKAMTDSQEYGSDDEHMVSRVFFYFMYKGQKHDLYANVKQTIGTSFEAGFYEVSPPVDYKGPFNHEAFRTAVANYLKSLVGSQGRGLHIGGGGNSETFTSPSSQASYNNPSSQTMGDNTPRVRMYNCVFNIKMTVEFDVAGPDSGW